MFVVLCTWKRPTKAYDHFQNTFIIANQEDIYKAIYNLDPEDPTDEPTTEPTVATSTEPTVQPSTDETKSETASPTKKPQPATISDSSTNSNASTTNSSVVQTGDVSYALVLLIILALAVGIVWVVRKKRFDL